MVSVLREGFCDEMKRIVLDKLLVFFLRGVLFVFCVGLLVFFFVVVMIFLNMFKVCGQDWEVSDILFDDIKFDMEVGGDFNWGMLIDEINDFVGKMICICGYILFSFY